MRIFSVLLAALALGIIGWQAQPAAASCSVGHTPCPTLRSVAVVQTETIQGYVQGIDVSSNAYVEARVNGNPCYQATTYSNAGDGWFILGIPSYCGVAGQRISFFVNGMPAYPIYGCLRFAPGALVYGVYIDPTYGGSC